MMRRVYRRGPLGSFCTQSSSSLFSDYRGAFETGASKGKKKPAPWQCGSGRLWRETVKLDVETFKLYGHVGTQGWETRLCQMQMNDGGRDSPPRCTDEMTQPFGIFNTLYLENENN